LAEWLAEAGEKKRKNDDTSAYLWVRREHAMARHRVWIAGKAERTQKRNTELLEERELSLFISV